VGSYAATTVRDLADIPMIVFFVNAIASPSSTFVLRGGLGSNVTISVNVPSNLTADDLFFHISGPSNQSWLAFGFGTEMQDALMFVAYKSQSGTNATLSPRIGSGQIEPKHTEDVEIDVLEGTTVDDQSYFINARCRKCRSWPLEGDRRGNIDVRSTTQPMMYAIGDSSFFQTNDLKGTIQKHSWYGKFKLDLRAATGDPGIPTNTTSDATVIATEGANSGRLGTIIHALIMGACFVVLFPVGTLLIRLPIRLAFYLHLIWQSFALLGVIAGFALGVYISIRSNRHPKLFNSVHQGLGIAVVALLLVQPVLGFLHHRSFKQTPSSTLVGKIHRIYLGPAVTVLGIINGALGLSFASNTEKLPAYFGFLIFVTAIIGLALWASGRKKVRNNATNSHAANNFREGMAHGDVPLQTYDRTNGNSVKPPPPAFAPPQYVNVMPKHEDQRMS
jgi:hypothetical protein